MRHVGLLETIRVRDGSAPLWGHHVARLYAACAAAGVSPPRKLDVPGGGPDRVVRLVVTSGGVEATEREPGSLLPVRLITSRRRHEPYPHKTTERRQFDEALAEAAAAQADDAILTTAAGWVAETSVWGLYWWENGRLVAPPLELGILDSVARRRLSELVPIADGRVAPDQLAARGAFVANAARGVVGVRSIDGRAVAADAETDALAASFWG